MLPAWKETAGGPLSVEHLRGQPEKLASAMSQSVQRQVYGMVPLANELT